MAEPQRKNLLKDLASAARREQETRVMSPVRALRLGLARTAAQMFDLALQVTEVSSVETGIDSLAGALPQDMLLALLDGPDGARGAVGLDRDLVAALIEVQTMGAVGTMAVSDRALTPTDAAMVAPWLDAALESVDVALHREVPGTLGVRDTSWIIGYRFGAMAEDARALALALDAPDFHLVRATVEVALGRRTGQLLLVMPIAPKIEAPGEPARSAPEDAFMEVPAELRVIAGRLRLPLNKAAALQPGDVLAMDSLLTEAAELHAVDGKIVGNVRLGRLGDHWAVRFAAANGAVVQAFGKGGRNDPASTSAAKGLAAPAGQQAVNARRDLPDVPPADLAGAQGLDMPVASVREPDMGGALPDLPPLDFDDPPATGLQSGGVGAPESSGAEIDNISFE